MTYCCVPLCKSDKKKELRKRKKITFHEFPSDLKLRVLWIRAIARKDPETNNFWCPSSTSVVCSLHFTPEQFKKDSKRRCLIAGSVPSIFPGYPEYLLHTNSTNIIKRVGTFPKKNASKKDKRNMPRNRVTDQNSGPYNEHSLTKKVQVSEADNGISEEINPDILPLFSSCIDNKISEDPTLEKLDSSQNMCQTDNDINRLKNVMSVVNSSISANVNEINTSFMQGINDTSLVGNPEKNLELPAVTLVSDFTPLAKNDISSVEKNPTICANNKDHMYSHNTDYNKSPIKENCMMSYQGTRVNDSCKSVSKRMVSGIPQVYKTKLQSAERQLRRYAAKIRKLREENKKLQTANEKFKQFNIEKLEEGIARKDERALFLNDQLRSLAVKEILFSISSMEFLSNFEEKFPTAYKFLRQTNILNLPRSKMLNFKDYEEHEV